MTIHELTEHGVERMSDEEIDDFLADHGFGVLGLPTEELPYMLPLSYGFDGEEYLYFTYVVGEVSQKELVTEETDVARFLVFETTTETDWTSISLDGTLTEVPDHEIRSLDESIETNWRPEALQAARDSADTKVYRFWIQNKTGIRQTDD